MEKKRILFVDDEQGILDGLKRMLRKFHKEWEMEFALSGKEALERFEKASFDVIVTDMRMPGMDGAELLKVVARKYPETIRIVLSGYSDLDTVMRVVSTAHRYLPKPSDAETLKELVDQAAILRKTINNDRVRKIVSRLQSIPSAPSVYSRIVEVLQKPQVSLQEIGKVISEDTGMTAKILQLVNSAFFGLRREVTSVSQAVGLLGLETIRALVLMVGIFRTFDGKGIPGFDLEKLRAHMLKVAKYAADFAAFSGASKLEVDASYLSGLLHDAGKLVLAAAMPGELSEIMRIFQEEARPLYEIEEEVLQTSHAEIGAYIMGAWGLPDEVVTAIAFHHTPRKSGLGRPGPLLFTHVANSIAHARMEGGEIQVGKDNVDLAYIQTLKMEDQVALWKKHCKIFLSEETEK